MSNYTKTTNFAIKDSLVTGNPSKIVKGTEVNTEFDNIASAVNSKPDANNGTHTGTATMVNLTVSGTLTATVDGGTY
jgi:hypothetical protein